MKQWKDKRFTTAIIGLLIPTLSCATPVIGYVDITHVFDNSSYIQEANKKLRSDADEMNKKLEAQRSKLRELIAQYHASKSEDAKKKLESPLKAEELILNNLSASFQKTIHDDELAGKLHFNGLLKKATEQVAKAKQVNAVLAEQNVLYSDKSWIDLTSEVERVMQRITAEEARG